MKIVHDGPVQVILQFGDANVADGKFENVTDVLGYTEERTVSFTRGKEFFFFQYGVNDTLGIRVLPVPE